MGMLPVLCLYPDIVNTLAGSLPAVKKSQAILDSSLCFYFVGVGDFGRKIGTNVYPSFQYGHSDKIPISSRMRMLDDPNKINFDSYPHKEHLIFLAGSPADKQFWTARKIILSKHPDFLISICPQEIRVTADRSMLSPNECWINLSQDEPMHTAAHIINDICSALSSPGPINLALEDICHALSNGTGFGITMESTKHKSVRELRDFVNRHLNTIKKHENLILFFSFDNGVDADMDHLTDLSEIVYRAVGDEMAIMWCTLDHRKLNPNFRATIIGS
jgi:hypothetical protein